MKTAMRIAVWTAVGFAVGLTFGHKAGRTSMIPQIEILRDQMKTANLKVVNVSSLAQTFRSAADVAESRRDEAQRALKEEQDQKLKKTVREILARPKE